jgi:hypothetical protein
MSWREAERLAVERMRLLEVEAALQRVSLAATFEKWEKRKALVWGSALAKWGFRLVAQPRVGWLLATTIISSLKRKRAR